MDNNIPKQSRPSLFLAVKKAMYTISEDEVCVEKIIEEADKHVVSPNNYVKYIANLVARKEEWALSFREGVPNLGKNTNNTAEAAMRVFKDKVCYILFFRFLYGMVSIEF